VYFSAPPSAIAELWQEYHLNEDLVRFVTLRADKVMEKIEFKPLVEQQ
jgi:small subunit ribosomal protein S6